MPAGYARVSWRQQRGWTVAFGVGHATRLPDQQERYYALKRMGSDWVGNPLLSPSRNTGLDAELHFTGHGVDTSVAAFVYRIDDNILVIDQLSEGMMPGVMNAAARSYTNADALVRGVEASATIPIARAVFLSADGSYVRGTMRESTSIGKDLPEMPPARARVRLRYDDARWNIAAEAIGAAGQDHVSRALHESPTPAYAVLNVRGGLRWRRLDVTAGIDNLLDTFYADHLSYQRDPFRSGVRVYEPGRTIAMNLGARF